ncbi:hypothetical protein [Coleofasciculus sp. FACHB-T130]|uniref:hypothetical protein n=1 Tax=Cyanophyceae TaxID=3028117 RepID=UPI001687800C|nr:hypothetical protein [Coleofasciculus sp. FACHB-T130]MBD1881169.1 hypothetical protein [Coleofasciculus sp. FACHB-T130]
MTGAIYLIQDKGQLVEMIEQPYDSEALLQKLLADYPSLLAGDQINSAAPRRWLLVSQEMPVPSEDNGFDRWALDHLFLDQDGIPTLVEVKRSCNTQIRREVAGQMLDYAANAVVYWPVEKIIAQFNANCQVKSQDSEQILSNFLGADANPSEFWEKVKTNLQAGKVRLVFVADKIPPELQRIVEFLNKQMSPAEVLAIEINQYVGQGLKTLVPRIIGQTVAGKSTQSLLNYESKQWNESLFFQELEAKKGSDVAQAARSVFNWINCEKMQVSWGKGKIEGSLIPRIISYKGETRKFFTIWSGGKIEIYAYEPPFNLEDKKTELLNRLKLVLGNSISVNAYNWYIPLFALKDELMAKQFLEVIDWAIQEIKAS